ncbi:anaerobic ribonucleoside-triphosphate reductase [Enterococcus faecium]|uniref:anaerobic ribonucleoside-triphosphate reductase n=1 Tax=Enterococcus faecium TaxID=1352 RepID=UPI00093FD5C4|nr:anaerobic ribonucleoside-triphosphate reductase [Enterococcus faecium]PHL10680.1 anaerobic ribonucleoside-triphosphate reductase [Enterococcus faecium]
MLKVMKKDGHIEVFDTKKIQEAILASARKILSNEEEYDMQQKALIIANEVARFLNSTEDENAVIMTSKIHNVVLEILSKEWEVVGASYGMYRNYRKQMAKTFLKSYEESETVLHDGDKENANKDSDLNSTKQALIANNNMRGYMETFEMDKDWVEAHKQGWIHIHDLAERYLRQQNCCLFNMAGLLDGGFQLNGTVYAEPKHFDSAINVVGDVTLFASAQQYGGFTIPEIDTVLAKYAEKSYQSNLKFILDKFGNITNEDIMETLEQTAYEMTVRELEQGFQGFETKLNTISNSLGQIPFVTITFGLDTTQWGREISKAILNVRIKGIGENKSTAVFPKLSFLHRKEINGSPESPNYDIKQLGIQCSRLRLYPDWLSLDSGNLAEVYERSNQVVSGMGCRAYLSPFWDEQGNEIYTGRSNIGAVTLNLPKIGLEAKGDWNKFFDLVDKYSDIIFAIHEDYYTKISKTKGSSNPLYFCEGGAWTKVGYDEEVGKIYEASTASLGYIGIYETLKAMNVPKEEYLKHGTKIVAYLKKLTEKATINYNHLYALYSTPAESLCYRFQKINRKDYGVIEDVTDREYITNSFHVPVWEDVSVPEKIAFEAPFHKLATGGRISYNEFVYGVDNSVLEQAINFAMENGMYYGVNVVAGTCNQCGYSGDFHDNCPKCGTHDITVVTRVCGYLSFDQIHGDSRYNPGKQKEVKERVKHNFK